MLAGCEQMFDPEPRFQARVALAHPVGSLASDLERDLLEEGFRRDGPGLGLPSCLSKYLWWGDGDRSVCYRTDAEARIVEIKMLDSVAFL